ncbi:MAG TPA: YHS domain-containing protein [Terriglobia bacterium]|nr:YHS domain-containing protein [Terriglobia bacterium]
MGGNIFVEEKPFLKLSVPCLSEEIAMRRTVVVVALILVFAATSMTVLAQAKKPPEKARDPVCGIIVEKDPNLSVNHRGETYYFCSKADMEKFKKEPEKYAKKK